MLNRLFCVSFTSCILIPLISTYICIYPPYLHLTPSKTKCRRKKRKKLKRKMSSWNLKCDTAVTPQTCFSMSPTSDHCKESLVCFLLYQCWALIRPLPEYPDFALYYKEPESLVWGQVWGQVSSCSPEGRHRWSGCWGSPNHKSGFGPGQPLGWSAK